MAPADNPTSPSEVKPNSLANLWITLTPDITTTDRRGAVATLTPGIQIVTIPATSTNDAQVYSDGISGKTAAIIGSSVGAFVLLLALGLSVFYVRRRKRRNIAAYQKVQESERLRTYYEEAAARQMVEERRELYETKEKGWGGVKEKD